MENYIVLNPNVAEANDMSLMVAVTSHDPLLRE